MIQPPAQTTPYRTRRPASHGHDAAERFTNPAAIVLTVVTITAIAFAHIDPVPKIPPPPEPTPVQISLAEPPPPPPPVPTPPQPPTPPTPRAVPQPVTPRPPPTPAPAELPAQPTTDATPVTAPPAPPAPPSPAPPPAPAANPADGAEAKYVADLRAYLNSVKRYPATKEAHLLRPSGAAEVRFTLSRAGTVHDVAVAKTSGSLILDQAALTTVRRGSYHPIPDDAWADQAEHVFTVTIEFHPEG